MSQPTPEQLGPPSLRLEFLEVWIQGRRFPDSQDHWDRSWLNVVVRYANHGASVWTKGAILQTVGVARFRDDLDRVYRTL